MRYNEGFIDKLKEYLQGELPGEEAQFSMAPVSRQRIREIPQEDYQPRQSAVLILLFPVESSLQLVLIQRPEYKGVHSGQVAFPGGRFEEEDRELSVTALREAQEEIGIHPDEVEILGKLTDIYITPSNFLVSPYIGYTSKKPDLVPHAREVDQIIYADLFQLNESGIRGEKSIVHSDGVKIKTPYYEIEGFTVWGATAMIIAELNALVAEIISS